MPNPILKILEPQIELDEMILVDRNDDRFKDLQDKSYSNQYPDEKTQGSVIPFITIRSIAIEMDELRSFEILCDDFFPSIFLTIQDNRKRFTNVDFPLDGDLISVYLRPNDDDVHKSIRCDFEIINVSRTGKANISYSFYGILRIPKIFDEICEAKRDLSSYETLMSVCSDLDLGFASNEDTTNDKQTWIVAKESRETFIKDVTKYCYKNDNAFFTSFIDLFYCLNFINIQECFSEDDSLEPVIHSTIEPADRQKDFEKVSALGPLFLTNSKSQQGTNLFISYYNPFNNCGTINIKNGYKRYVQFYDFEENELIENYIEPLITNGNEDKVLLRGRRDEDFFKSNERWKWVGKQSSGEDGNVHDNYLFARILNHQNLEEISKAGLKITLEGFNTDIMRYRRIPIIIYDSHNLETRDANVQRDENLGDNPVNEQRKYTEQEEVRNEFLSGFYVCQSFSIRWTPKSKYVMDITMVRREWNKRASSIGAIKDES